MVNIQLREIKTQKIDYHYYRGKLDDSKIGYNIEEKADSHYDFTLIIKYYDEMKEGIIRSIEVAMSALLIVSDDEDSDNQSKDLLIKNTGATILFPYIRALLTTLTTNDTNGKMIILPVTNVAALIEGIDKNQRKESQKQSDEET